MKYTLNDIVHHTGLPADKVTEICNFLITEGYLIYEKDNNKYRLTEDSDLLGNVKKMWKQCKDDHLFEQMSFKIEDIIQFGKPLALAEKGPDSKRDDIGIPGINFILGNVEDKTEKSEKSETFYTPGIPRGHCVLIKGAPGTGKTTLGMQIALHLKDRRSRFLTFEEDVNQLVEDFDPYLHHDDKKKKSKKDGRPESPDAEKYQKGWRKKDIRAVTRSLIKIRTPQAWENPDGVMAELISILDSELPHLVVIDSISRFRDLGGDEKARMVLGRLIRSLKCRRITAIFLAEDRADKHPFEDYDVDGVMQLGWAGDTITLSVRKLRGLKDFKGPHSAALMSVDDFEGDKNSQHLLISDQKVEKIEEEEEKKRENKEQNAPHHEKKGNSLKPFLTVGFNVFPEISVYKDISANSNGDSKKEDKKPEYIETGTKGLDDLLPATDREKGFKKKETILLVGSAGAGKTLLALNFMLAGFDPEKKGEDKDPKKGEKTLWLNFEGDKKTLEFAVSGFDEPYKGLIKNMLDSSENPPTDWEAPRFDFVDFPPINLDLNKIVFTLEAIYRTYGIDRLVIDSITELERAKGEGQTEVKVFLAGLIQFLRERKITTLFVCRSDAFFHSIDKIEEQVASLVDLIICIRSFDIHNQIQKGIYIQKARGRRHNSKIMRLNIDSKSGMSVEDSGWDLENLLAGDSRTIDKPKVFFKLFYENPAETYINQSIIDDFDKKRYPGTDPSFSLVKKPSIYTEFWSFKGQYSAGHANTRVLSIPDHVISAFRDNNRLQELEKYVKSEVIQNIKSEKPIKYQVSKKKIELDEENQFLSDNENSNEKKDIIIDAVPCYRDYGVMVLRCADKEYLGCVEKKQKEKEIDHPFPKSLNEKKQIPFEKALSENNAWKALNKFLTDCAKSIDTSKPYSKTSIEPTSWIKGRQLSEIYLWENLLELLKNPEEFKKNENKEDVIFVDACGQEIFPFAFPPLDQKSEFVAFFMELLWSYGGDIYKPNLLLYPFLTFHKEEKTDDLIRESSIIEFLGYYQGNKGSIEEKKNLILSALRKKKRVELNDNDEEFTFIQRFEERFRTYGFESRNIKIREFKDWICDNLDPDNKATNSITEIDSSVLRLRGLTFKKAIKLMLDLVFLAGVKNPIDGEFRHNAFFSRNWYSRVAFLKQDRCNHCHKYETKYCSMYKTESSDTGSTIDGVELCGNCKKDKSIYPKIDETHSLLPLPLAEVEIGIEEENLSGSSRCYRSVTCMTYWSLVMLNNALSPEIGGNFIESINAPEYYEERLKYRLGMPVMNWQVKKEKFYQFHKESYSIFHKIVENYEKSHELGNKITEIAKKHLDLLVVKDKKEEEKEKEKKLAEDKLLEEMKGLIKKEWIFVNREFFQFIGNDEVKKYLTELSKENSDNIPLWNNNLFYPKVRQSRTAFYQIEQALHFQLRLLFMKDPGVIAKKLYQDNTETQKEEKDAGSSSPKKKYQSIYERIETIYDFPKNIAKICIADLEFTSRDADAIFEEIKKEFSAHVAAKFPLENLLKDIKRETILCVAEKLPMEVFIKKIERKYSHHVAAKWWIINILKNFNWTSYFKKTSQPQTEELLENIEQEFRAHAASKLQMDSFFNTTERKSLLSKVIESLMESLLDDIEREFRTHVVFELLTYFFLQHQRGADKE